MIVSVPIILLLVARAINAAPVPYQNSRALVSRQFDLSGIDGSASSDTSGFSSSDTSGSSSFDPTAAAASDNSGSSFDSTSGNVSDFLGGGDNSADPSAAAAATPDATQTDSFGNSGATDTTAPVDASAAPVDASAAPVDASAAPVDASAAPADTAATPAADPAAASVASPDATAAAAAPDASASANTNPDPNAASAAVGACGPPGINAATVSLIKSFEGFVASPSPDPIGLPTVGFGHLCKSTGCAEVPFPFPLTQSTAAQLLQNDVQPFIACINGAVSNSAVLNDNQLGALTAWSFNVGCGAAKASTLVKRLNNGEDPNTVAAQELPKFNKAGGKVLAGLTRRRAAEVALFQTPSNVQAHPC